MKRQNSKNQNSDNIAKHEAEIAYGFLLSLRNTDLHLLWTRASFFLAIEGGLMGFVLWNIDKKSIVLPLIGVYGFFIAIIWIIITHYGCKWLKEWEKQLKDIEGIVFPKSPHIPIFRENENRKFSISIKETLTLVSYFNMVVWLFLVVFFYYHYQY